MNGILGLQDNAVLFLTFSFLSRLDDLEIYSNAV
jgi:hypothetical protein